ncbi:MAG: hypothetical protein OXC28_01710 [Defluviicoccus sp.]|nr:hypothetical protein [Defluviicoccus sp.]
MTEKTEKRSRGQPTKNIPKLDATPEQAARAIFSAAKPPDLSLRVPKKKLGRKPLAS